MPVWHERTKAAAQAGTLRVLAICQEQHPERCRLFCQWKGIDWPILWDPFNLTGSKAVPNFTLVDEYGVIRTSRARPHDLDAFLSAEFEAPAEVPRPTKGPRDRLVETLGNEPVAEAWMHLSEVLWNRTTDPGALIEALEADPTDAAGLFRLGVARRMRHDSRFATTGDFQEALDAWTRALVLRPDQYIWRRRIQQYGPRPDKPYPFYDWVERARRDLVQRGEIPIPLPAPLTATERGAWGLPEARGTEPDPQGLVPPFGEGPLFTIDPAVAWDTSRRSRTGRLHLLVRFSAPDSATWVANGEPLVVWIDAPAGSGWHVEPRRLATPVPAGLDEDTGSTAPVSVECDVAPPESTRPPLRLGGYLLAPVCRKGDGSCLLIRQNFEVELEDASHRGR